MATPRGTIAAPRALGAAGRAAQAWRSTARAFRRNPNMAAGALILVLMGLIALAAPLITTYDPLRIDPFAHFEAPTAEHWFGTDNQGRDLYTRTVFGARISLLVGAAVAVITSVLGAGLGLVTGYFRRVDNVVMRFMDGLMAIPGILLAIALMALLGASIQNVVIALTVVDTPRTVRVVRASVLSLREWAFVDAARSIGAPTWRILALHILPNTVAPLIIQATYIFASAVLTEASLSFLGAGVPPIIPSWGNIMGEGRLYIQQAPWITFFPGTALFLTVLGINLLGDGLRDNLDPKLRRRL